MRPDRNRDLPCGLENALRHHRVRHLHEPRNVGAIDVAHRSVSPLAVVYACGVDTAHDIGQVATPPALLALPGANSTRPFSNSLKAPGVENVPERVRSHCVVQSVVEGVPDDLSPSPPVAAQLADLARRGTGVSWTSGGRGLSSPSTGTHQLDRET